MNRNKSILTIIISLIAIVAVLVITPWFTFEAFQRVTDGEEFGFGGWLAAFWLMLLMGGAAASNR